MEFEQAHALNYAIRLIGIRHRARAAALLGQLGLSPGQEIVLLALAVGGTLTQAQIANEAGCEPPSVTQMVQKLEAAGLITRRKSPDDARVIMVDLSDAGRQLLPALQTTWQQLAEESVAKFSSLTVDELIKVAGDLAASLQRTHPAQQSLP
jgi:DNA-binding MarR family transcriptional regulator